MEVQHGPHAACKEAGLERDARGRERVQTLRARELCARCMSASVAALKCSSASLVTSAVADLPIAGNVSRNACADRQRNRRRNHSLLRLHSRIQHAPCNAV